MVPVSCWDQYWLKNTNSELFCPAGPTKFSGLLEAFWGSAPTLFLHCLDPVLPAASSGADVGALHLSSCSIG